MAVAPAAERHAARSAEHYATAEMLEAAGNEWASVCYFYATFRAVRCALQNDTRLDSDANARAAHDKLTASSRHVDFHNGHPSRGPGVNAVVRFLYPSIGSKYQLLHTKSVEVRYQGGLTAGTISDTRKLADEITAELRGMSLIP